MCGRYFLTSPTEEIEKAFPFKNRLNIRPRYNIGPTQDAPIIALDAGDTVFRMARWGLIPVWAREIGSKPLFNARSETALEKPAFRAPMRRGRCLVPADGFYEWQKQAGGKPLAFCIRRPDQGLFMMAGLWTHWADPQSADELISFAVLTTTASQALSPLHHRMPVVLDGEARADWLKTSEEDVKSLLKYLQPPANDYFRFYRVSPDVGKVANDRADLIEPVSDELPSKGGQFSLF